MTTPALAPLIGHDAVRRATARASARGELPGSMLVQGPPGVGKQRFALWLGQLVLCEAPSDTGPCEQCRSCRLAARLEHPDLHWFFPLVRPKGTSADRLADALEDARAAEIQTRRETPFRAPVPGEPTGIFLAQMQTLRRLAMNRPAMGSRKVFVVGQAERLVPQESSQEAANALLKLLEEPPADTVIMLTASDPEALLPTIRSRVLPIRLHPLPVDDVARMLVRELDVDAPHAQQVATIAQGSIGRAIGYLPTGKSAGALEEIRAEARELLAAALADDDVARLHAAHARSPAGARGAFSDVLEQLSSWIRDLAATAAHVEDTVVNVDALAWLRQQAEAHPAVLVRADRAIAAVEEAMDLAQGNVNPQLVVAGMLRRLRRELAA